MSGISNRRHFAASLCSSIVEWTHQSIRPFLYRFGQWLVIAAAPKGIDENRELSLANQSAPTVPSATVVPLAPVHESIPVQVLPSVCVERPIAAPTIVATPACETRDEISFENSEEQHFFAPPPEREREHDEFLKDRLVTIGAVCNVLEVLERQLADVNQDVESSVAGVCKGFQGMAVRAQSAVNAASKSVGSGVQSGGGKDLIAEMQSVLTTLIENVRSSSEFTKTVSGKLINLESRLEAVENTLKNVETLANKAKLVALNGQIEAARLGTAGLAFAVVAKETKTLSTNAAETSDAIRTLVGELSNEVKITSAEIRNRTESDERRFLEMECLARGLLNDIDVSHKQMLDSLNTTSEISGELRGDISRAVMSMQFQDRVSQRIAHVVETMEVLVERVDPKSIQFCEIASKDRSNLWLSEIAKTYTMDSERVALGTRELTIETTDNAVEEFDVELF